MLNPGSTMARLLGAPMRPGRVEWIGVRPARREAPAALDWARLEPGRGLAGDHYAHANGPRAVTLIQAEHLSAIAAFLGTQAILPAALRRNVVVSGINLLALKGARFQLGKAMLEYTGQCHPCSRMEEALGAGGYNAVRGHGGITARIVASGDAGLGDPVCRVETAQ